MCVYSMVLDQLAPLVPEPIIFKPDSSTVPLTPWGPIHTSPLSPALYLTPEKLREILDAFRQMSEAAKAVDMATGQTDCADPEKQKLERRVEYLERALAGMRKPKSKRRARKRRTSR